MKIDFNALKNSTLFDSIDFDNMEKLLKSIDYTIKNYKAGDTIAMAGNICSSIGIVIKGDIEIHRPFPSGKIVTINNFQSGGVFGEALLFSKENKYPTNVISLNESTIMFIEKSELKKLMTYSDEILNNFLSILSNRIIMLKDRITTLSLDTLRKKIANIILSEYAKQKTNLILMPFSRKQMAKILNIPRPSLSRELSKMKEDKIIDFNKNQINILNMDLLEAVLIE